jgi:hypothetical protein
VKLCDINAHFRDEIPCNTFKFIYNLAKNIAYKDHGFVLFKGIMVARFDIVDENSDVTLCGLENSYRCVE